MGLQEVLEVAAEGVVGGVERAFKLGYLAATCSSGRRDRADREETRRVAVRACR